MKILVTGGCGQLGMSLRTLVREGALENLPGNGGDLSRNGQSSEGRALGGGVSSSLGGGVSSSPGGVFEFIFSDVVSAPETVFLDITDLSALRAFVAQSGVQCIINCAAYTNVEAAEDHEDLAELLNATAVGNLATVMKEVGGLLVHISTDYVFGREAYNRPCREDQQGTPTGVYGLTKLHGEQAILESGVRHIIIRTSWLYSEYGKNFLKTMLTLTATKPSLKVVFDQVGTPTYAPDLAAAILTILRHLSAAGAFAPLRPHATCGSLGSYATCDSLGSHDTCGSLGSHATCGSLGPHETCGSLGSHETCGSLGSHDTCGSLGSHATCGSVGPHAEGEMCTVSEGKTGLSADRETGTVIDEKTGIVTVGETGNSEIEKLIGVYHFSNEGVCSWYDFARAIAEGAGHTSCDIQPCHSDEFPSKVIRPAYSVLDKTKIKTTFGLRIPHWTTSLRTCLQHLLPPE